LRRPTRLRDLSDRIGITERATQGILGDLEAAGFVDRRRACGSRATSMSTRAWFVRKVHPRPSPDPVIRRS
jgi:Mn-dependent DtxR family transcriptional regulator